MIITTKTLYSFPEVEILQLRKEVDVHKVPHPEAQCFSKKYNSTVKEGLKTTPESYGTTSQAEVLQKHS